MQALSALKASLGSDSLRGRTLSSGLWTLAHHGASQALRFAGNVVLARLLFPEAFGVMLLVNTVMQGLEMFSDVGVAASLVRSQRGEDPAYLRTAWTIKVVRGVALWAVAAVLSHPASLLFDKPELAVLLPVAAITAPLIGLQATRVHLASRALDLRRVTMLHIASQVVAIVVMVSWAWLWPSVWALVLGSLVGSALTTLGSHLLLPGRRDGFGWDREAARDMLRFGRWVFVSTAMAFLAARGDSLVMGRLLTTTELGVYSIAISLAQLVPLTLGQIGTNVLFPAYSRVYLSDPDRLQGVLRRCRLTMLGLGALGHAPFIFLGGVLIQSVYDPRYAQAGWMLQTLSCGFAVSLVQRSYAGVLHAQGLSFESTVLQFFQVVIKFACFTIGFVAYGLPGFVIGVAFSSWISYPVVALILARAGVWQPRIDAAALSVGAILTAVFFQFEPMGLAA